MVETSHGTQHITAYVRVSEQKKCLTDECRSVKQNNIKCEGWGVPSITKLLKLSRKRHASL